MSLQDRGFQAEVILTAPLQRPYMMANGGFGLCGAPSMENTVTTLPLLK